MCNSLQADSSTAAPPAAEKQQQQQQQSAAVALTHDVIVHLVLDVHITASRQ
jgi:hypothetical protein